jgi:hypothetical protein
MNPIDNKNSGIVFPSTLTSILLLTLALTWVFSLRPVRIQIGDYCYNHGYFDQAVNWYSKVLRKEALSNTCEKQLLVKLINACTNSAQFHLNLGEKYLHTNLSLAEMELMKALLTCNNLSRYILTDAHELTMSLNPVFVAKSILKRICIAFSIVYKLGKPETAIDLFRNYSNLYHTSKDLLNQEEWTEIFSSLSGLNLIENPHLMDPNNDGIPDGYTYACGGPDATPPHKECIKTKNCNIYHVWQEKGRGWFATYFNIGRILPNTYFTFSIDIKRVNIEGGAHARLYTTRLSDRNWGAGNDYSETGVSIDLKDGWKREFHTIKTKDYSDILLSGWIVAWDYGQAGGHIYVCKPKLEIGNKPTL